MVPQAELSRQFFLNLYEIDVQVAQRVAVGGCPYCGGPLYRSDYPRKPRGARWGGAGEEFTRRLSLCCGREGCRKRTTPPSLRFLGRKVYLEAIIVWVCAYSQVIGVFAKAAREFAVAARTLRRWRTWWRVHVPKTPLWLELRGRFIPPPPDETALPRSLVERAASSWQGPGTAGVSDVLERCGQWLAPLTTASFVGGARFPRGP